MSCRFLDKAGAPIDVGEGCLDAVGPHASVSEHAQSAAQYQNPASADCRVSYVHKVPSSSKPLTAELAMTNYHKATKHLVLDWTADHVAGSLNRFVGLSYAEIARRCGITIKAAEYRMPRALALCQAVLRD